MKYLLLIMLLLFTGCQDSKPKIKVTCKYKIWLGDAFISIGYCTDTYIIKNEMLFFIDKRAKKSKIVPMHQLKSIDIEE